MIAEPRPTQQTERHAKERKRDHEHLPGASLEVPASPVIHGQKGGTRRSSTGSRVMMWTRGLVCQRFT